ncbi:MAG: cupin domain-containing protein [Microlunatus sp.]|nr:cupin domain-containing protein [Microlunatus sp.]MDN5771895.1 cupin domain-containing protein [Microlunatus sp.]MDN5803521.1 cupin domain-containing protein [Microlunatus sp.]
MELRTKDEALLRQPPRPNGPTVAVFFGGDEAGPDVGVVRVDVPPGGGMPAHKHNGSDVILCPISGRVQITKDEESIEVRVGDAALVRKDEAVALTNPGDEVAQVIVAAGPAAFIAGIRSWPEPE